MKSIVALMTVGLLRAVALAQPPTIPQRVAESAPERYKFSIQSEMLSFTPERLTALADLIVVGTPVKVRSYISDDQMSIYTDYQISPTRVLWATTPRGSAVPQGSAPIIIRRLGGTVLINGIEATETNEDTSPIDKEEGLLFLRQDRDGTYHLVHELEGVFYVRSGRVFPAHDVPAYAAQRGQELAGIQSDISRLKR